MIADRVCFVHDLLMKRLSLFSICLLLLVLALPASAEDRADEVRAAEIAFAKAFADRDAKRFDRAEAILDPYDARAQQECRY